jgi:hypothetical protein
MPIDCGHLLAKFRKNSALVGKFAFYMPAAMRVGERE